ncbi:DUF4349 domain-containing protein [Ectobacillus funiculus]|uniref:DUF4349 domain-containing protein n=1 Tax=Ectobacillus funiculus TaxID=137993 RepID=UPI0013E9A5C1|nr:DUF4349 domain-containing protein [Ectobacillus funiculus]
MKRHSVQRILAMLCFVAILFTGCSSAEQKNSAEMSMSSDSAKMEGAAPAAQEKTDQPADMTAPAKETPSVVENRKLIKNVEVRMETTEFDASIGKVEASVGKFGGYVEGSSVSGVSVQENSSSTRSASYTIRIPANKLDDYLKEAGTIGNITSKQIMTEDVTSQYFDTEARLKSLKMQEERLLELLKQTGSLKDVIEIEKELAAVRYEIEGLTTTLKRYDSLVDYSTIRIELTEVQSLTQNASTLGERIGVAFKKSVTSISNGAQGLLVFVIGNSPVLLLLGAGGAVVFFAVRRIRRNKK